jgi:hypothetical protein
MDGPTRDEVALSARDAVRTTAPGDRPRFLAALAFRLAELGHAKAITVQVAGTAEACEAVRSFLVNWRRDGSQVARRASVASGSVQEACAGQSENGPGGSVECYPGETRACGACGESFRVNPRHSKAHRYCSAACRSRERHRLKALS